MTFGRPAAIPDNYVKLELPIDLTSADVSMSGPDLRRQKSVQFFNATMWVSDIRFCLTFNQT
jgi:hypothetical protein